MLTRFVELLTRGSLRAPWLVLSAVLAVTLWAAIGTLTRSTTEVGYRTFLGEDHPAIRSLDRLIAEFGGGLPVVAVWRCGSSPCDSALDRRSLEMAWAVERALAGHPLVRRVVTPASAPIVDSHGDGVRIDPLVLDGIVSPDRERLARIALSDPLWTGRLVSPDGMTGAIVVFLSSSDSRTTAEIVPALQEVLRSYEDEGFEFHLVGDPVDFVVSGGDMQRETPRLTAIMIALTAVVLFILTRTIAAVCVALATSGAAVLWSVGSMAWLGWPQMELMQALPPVILVIGVCDAVHFLSRYAARGDDDQASRLLSTVREIALPCLLTSLTTIAAFLSFSSSGIESFVRFGIVAAIGVSAAFLVTFTALPVVAAWLPPAWLRPGREAQTWPIALRSLTSFTARRHMGIVLAAIALLAVGAVGARQLRVDVNEAELFGKDSQVVEWADFVRANLRKPDTLELEVTAPPGDSATTPAGVHLLERIHQILGDHSELGTPTSLLSHLDRLQAALSPSSGLPNSRAGIEELVLLLRSQGRGDVDAWLSFDGSSMRVSVAADSISTEDRASLLQQIDLDIRAALPQEWSHRITGPLAVYASFVDEILATQLWSFSTAAGIITAVLFFFLWFTGSTAGWAFFYAAAAALVSALPIVLTLGVMGFLGIPLDVGTTMVAAIVLGIAVDDSIHLLLAYREEREKGSDQWASMAAAVARVGRALVTTSLALSFGFFTLLLSSWQSLASFGFLSGVAILGALAADLFLLPALVALRYGAPQGPPASGGVTGIPPQGTKTLVSIVTLAPVAVVLIGVLLNLPDAEPRSVAEATAAAAILLSTAVSCGVCLLVWYSSARAAIPMALMYSSLTVGCIFTIYSEGGALNSIPLDLAFAFLPAFIVHLALSFPHPRDILIKAPRTLIAIYGVASALASTMIWSRSTHSTLWRIVLTIDFSLILFAWTGLVVSCWVAMRESNRTLERTRARVALYGVVLCSLPTAFFFSRGELVLASVGALFAPVPLAYSVLRYQFYSLRPAIARGFSRYVFAAVYAAVISLLVFNFAGDQRSILSLSVILVLLLMSEGLRERFWARLGSRANHLREAEREIMQTLRGFTAGPGEVAEAACQALRDALGSRGVGVYIQEGRRLLPIAGVGSPPTQLDVSPFEVTQWGPSATLGPEGGWEGPLADSLRSLDVSLLLTLQLENTVGVIAICPAPDAIPYRDAEIAFSERVASQTAVAMENARLTSQTLREERFRTLELVRVGVLHQIGKALTITQKWADALAKEEDPHAMRLGIEAMGRAARDGDSALGSFIAQAMGEKTTNFAPLDNVLERAASSVRATCRSRIALHLPTDLPAVTGPDELVAAFHSIMGNAALAADDGSVDVYVSADARRVSVTVADEGPGMDSEILERIFEPFFSTRLGNEGRGVGLASAKAIVERLGGTIAVESEIGHGTNVTVVLASAH